MTTALHPQETTAPRSTLLGRGAKRAFDIVFAILGLIVFAPLLLAIAVAVKIGSPGPVFYRGERTGRFGKPFRIFKFRSMIVDAEKAGGTTTGQNDPRVTAIGGILRKYKLDETPQLFNVLFGDMSFVGPRPEVAEYTDRYSEVEKLILSVRPGVTDYSSLQFHDLQAVVGQEDPDEAYRRNILPEKLRLRLKYVREHSFWGDMCILGRTVGVLLAKPFRRNA
jgi:lipopolysaccharide/colanic/teichoic acid biosynthesis glycosyltransferase